MTDEQKIYTLESINPPALLAGQIIETIHTKARRKTQLKFATLSFISTSSLAFCIYFFASLWKSFLSSGFYDYLSLVTSDASTLGLFWKELLLSLTESVPALSLTVFLIVSGVFIWSSSKTFRTASILKVI